MRSTVLVPTTGWRMWLAPVVLTVFVGLSVAMTPGEPELISVFSIGLGYGLGLTLAWPPSRRGWLYTAYASAVSAFSINDGRGVAISLISGIAMALILMALTLLGDRLNLHGMKSPSDASRLGALAVLSGLLVPIATVAGAIALNRQSELAAVLPQSALTGIGGILLATSMVLAYESGGFVIRGVRRMVEFAVLFAAIMFLLIGVSMMNPHTITGAAPLFLLAVVMGWMGLRFGTSITSSALVAIACWIGFGVTWQTGVFVGTTETELDALLAAQVYVCVLAAGILYLSVYARFSREQDTESRRATQLLASAADGAAAQVFIKNYDASADRFVYLEVNENFAAEFGLQPADVVGLSDEDLHPPASAAEFHRQDTEIMQSGQPGRFEATTTVRGRRVNYFASKFPVYDHAGEVVGVGGVSLDRTEDLRRTALLQQVFTHSPVPTARLGSLDPHRGRILEVNHAFATLVGLPAQRIVGRNLADVLTSNDLLRTRQEAGTQRREVRLRRPDGTELTVLATSAVVGMADDPDQFALLILEDVTATRAAEAGLVHRATHDPLTDLYNRQALIELLAARAGSGTVPHGTALWCCDIDGFKQFNDSLGHDTGDRVLLAMADRIRATVSAQDLVGRLGADEFVVVSSSPVDDEAALTMGERIRTAIAAPLEMDGRTHTLQVSVGLAVSTGDVGPEELLRQADVALTRAKDLGRNRIEVYLPELDRRVQLRVAMRETLRKALAENRIDIQVQPVISLHDGVTVGAEALVRLRDLDGTLLPPAAFIPVAEESGLIVPLGLRVLDLSLALCARWEERGMPLEIAVNVSPRQLESTDFAATVATLLQIHGVPAQRLALEVTESTVVDASGQTLSMLQELRDTGVHVAIDDFGTGYSSLASLRDLPADIVKIDRSFVSGLGVDPGDEAIVRAVLAMAHATGRVVVAEGVENPSQAQELAHFHCDRVQGYLYSRPVPPIDFRPDHIYGPPSVTPKQSRDQHPS